MLKLNLKNDAATRVIVGYAIDENILGLTSVLPQLSGSKKDLLALFDEAAKMARLWKKQRSISTLNAEREKRGLPIIKSEPVPVVGRPYGRGDAALARSQQLGWRGGRGGAPLWTNSNPRRILG